MKVKFSGSGEVADIIMQRKAFVFSLPVRERLLIVRHLLNAAGRR